MKKVKLDFETQSASNLKKVGAYEYSMHETTKAMCLSFKIVGRPKIWLFSFHQMQKPYLEFPLEFRLHWGDWVRSEEFCFSAHNAYFEQCIYQNVLVDRLGWPALPIRKWRCTAAKAAACALPRNLEGAGAAMNLRIQKDKEGHRVMMKLCKPTQAWNKWDKKGRIDEEPPMFWTPETAPDDFKTLYKYCKIDVLAEECLDLALPDLTPTEQEMWFIDQKINFRGVTIDMPAVKKILKIMEAETKVMNKELDTLTMGLVSSGNARNQILEFLKLEGLTLPDLKAKTVEDFLENGKATGDSKILLKLRRTLSKASTKKYDAFLRSAATDGRLRDLYLYWAASTGRWGGKGAQPQNLPRGTIKDIDHAIHQIMTLEVDDLKMLYGENLMPLFASCLRGMFVATKGKELFVDDYNAIETRVLWWLADHTEGLKLFYENRDPYKEQASDIFKKSIMDIDDEGDERQTGKAAVLGCGYQMGWKKFITAAFDVYRVQVTPEIAKVAVTSYRKKHWPVVDYWANCNNAAIAAVENKGKRYKVGRIKFFYKDDFLWIQLPSGRCLAYKSPKVIWRTVTLPEEVELRKLKNGKIKRIVTPERTFETKVVCHMAQNSKTRKWEVEYKYGGIWVENIVQSVSRDILAEAIVRAEKKNVDVLMHSHDELVGEKEIGKFSVAEFQKIMTELPKWAGGLPLKSKGWTALRYRK